jgi:uncharacterized delta-60 repeat protein
MGRTRSSPRRGGPVLILSLVLALLSLLPTLAETAPALSWSALQDGAGHSFDSATAVTSDMAGNVYVTGQSDQDYVTFKYHPNGVVAWMARYAGPAHGIDSPTSIAVDADGAVYVTGGSYGGSSDYDIATVKYNPSGVQVWANRYNGTGNRDDVGRAVRVDAEGNVVVAGYGWEFGTAWDYVTLKYAADGLQLWSVRYDGTQSSDHATAMGLDAQGNVYVTGESAGGPTGYDFATVKYGPDGTLAWSARYDGPLHGADSANALQVGTNGSVWVTGVSSSPTNTDAATLRYSADGTQLWVARYNGPGNGPDATVAVTTDAAENAYIVGQTWSAATGYDYLTVKYGPSGAPLWSAFVDGNKADDGASAVAVDPAGTAYVTGRAVFSSDSSVATVNYTAGGVRQWLAPYDGPIAGPAGGNALALTADGGLIVAGAAWTAVGGQDFVTLRYPAPAPDAPSALAAVLAGPQVVLTWQHGGVGLSGFELQRKIGSGSFTLLTSLSADTRTYLDAAVVPGGSYTYRVIAVGPGGESAPSNLQLVALPGGTPGKLKVPARINFGTVRLGKTKQVKVKLTNVGKGSLQGAASVSPTLFTVVSGGTFSLAPKKSATLLLQFAPNAPGVVTGDLSVSSDDPTRPLVAIPILGKAK